MKKLSGLNRLLRSIQDDETVLQKPLCQDQCYLTAINWSNLALCFLAMSLNKLDQQDINLTTIRSLWGSFFLFVDNQSISVSTKNYKIKHQIHFG